MISDLARYTNKLVEYVGSIFRRPAVVDTEPLVSDITETISKITANQRNTEHRLSQILDEAQDLLRNLNQKEQEQVAQWKKKNETFLEGLGIDKSCIDEFLASPTVEKLDELKKRFPKAFE